MDNALQKKAHWLYYKPTMKKAWDGKTAGIKARSTFSSCFRQHCTSVFSDIDICEPLSNLLPIFHVWEHLINDEIPGISIIYY